MENQSVSATWRPGLGGVEEGRKVYAGPPHAAGRVDRSSQSALIRGFRDDGELIGGVTGALMEPFGMYSCGSLEEDADDDPDERFLSHGMREFPSALGFGG